MIIRTCSMFPGEDLPNVSHYYREPSVHFGQKVAVIGGKNSAVEAALDLFRHGVNVAIFHRGESFGKSIKYWILPDIENRVKNGEIMAHFNSRVLEIKPGKITFDRNGKREEIANDFVYALTGYHPAVNFLRGRSESMSMRRPAYQAMIQILWRLMSGEYSWRVQ